MFLLDCINYKVRYFIISNNSVWKSSPCLLKPICFSVFQEHLKIIKSCVKNSFMLSVLISIFACNKQQKVTQTLLKSPKPWKLDRKSQYLTKWYQKADTLGRISSLHFIWEQRYLFWENWRNHYFHVCIVWLSLTNCFIFGRLLLLLSLFGITYLFLSTERIFYSNLLFPSVSLKDKFLFLKPATKYSETL